MKVEEKLKQRMEKADSLLCVGLDANWGKLPARFLKKARPQFEFNRWVIDQTYESCCAYKPNMAFYEARGEQGWRELRLTMEYLKSKYPDVVLIGDAKRADIGSTNEGYAVALFDELGFDAVTLQPYLGREALMPFLERADKACIILCRTSNPGAGEIQDLEHEGKKIWEIVAEKVANEWNELDNCMLVAGATYPDELARIREIVGEMTLLLPGVGVQGGEVDKVVEVGQNSQGAGLVINSSRGVIFAPKPAEAAENLRVQINQHRRSR